MEGDLDVHMVEDIKRVLLVELGLEKEKKKKKSYSTLCTHGTHAGISHSVSVSIIKHCLGL